MGRLTSKRLLQVQPDYVYDITTKNHNFFANGILVHNCGASSTTQAQNLLKLDAPFKIGASGTLCVNSPESCRMPLHWIDVDHATLTNFKSQYCIFGEGIRSNQIIGYKNLETLREEIDSCSLRRTLTDVRKDMPPLIIDVEYLEMEEDQQKFYEAIKDGVKEEADKIDLKATNLLALTTRLRQAIVAPGVLTTQPIESIKVTRALEFIEEIVSQGEKVVVFSMFKEPLNQLASKLDRLRFTLNTGDVSDDTVMRNVAEFQESPEAQVFLGTFSKMGVGYTLSSSMYMLCLDTPYTFSLFEQGYQRIYRVTNTRPAFIKVLLCNETIDERIWQIVESKKDLGEFLVDGKENSLSVDLKNELAHILRTL